MKSWRTDCLLGEDIRNKLSLTTRQIWKGKFLSEEGGVLHKAEGAVLDAGYGLALLVAMPALTRGAAVGVYLKAEWTLQGAA